MDFVDTYSEVTAAVDDISTLDQLEAFVHRILQAYDLKHAVYYMPGLPGQEDVRPVSIITYPIRGPTGESALFSVTSDLPDPEWALAKKTYVRDLQILAHTIHAKAMQISGAKKTDYRARLVPRERECLTWCAVGKTSEDIATILGISEGVVRIHL